MFGFQVGPNKRRVDVKQERLIQDKIDKLEDVIDYFISEGIFDQWHKDELLKIKNRDVRISKMVDLIHKRSLSGFKTFIDALLSTNQSDLARALAPSSTNPNMAGDGNFSRSGKGSNNNERTSTPGSSSTGRENERRHEPSREDFREVPQADGLNGIKVKLCDSLPPGFNESECYKHSSKPKGLAIIFNHRYFDKPTTGEQQKERIGTDVDRDKMKNVLTEIGYKVQVENNLTSSEMFQEIAWFSVQKEHNQCDSAVVVILTHGILGSIYASDGNLIKIETFISYLNGANCPGLKNKPKLFIIQACRGETYDEGVDGGAQSCLGRNQDDERMNRKLLASKEEEAADAKSIKKIPTGADIMIAYSTTPNYYSWRHEAHGSWFIQAICDVFARNAWKEEIHHLFTEVNRIVSQKISKDGYKQIPEPRSCLTKKFYLLPGYHDLDITYFSGLDREFLDKQMAGFILTSPKNIDVVQLRLIQEKIDELPKVIDYLISEGIFDKWHGEELSQEQDRDKRISKLVELTLRRKVAGFNCFIDALLSTGQSKLAQELGPSLDLKMRALKITGSNLTKDGNCASGGSRSSSSERTSISGSSSTETIEEPKAGAIQENEKFYSRYRVAYPDIEVPQTDGVLRIMVTECKSLPLGFNEIECYKHLSKPKGLAIIFNNRRFTKNMNLNAPILPERHGTDVDCKNMENLLTQLGYEVRVKNDLTREEMYSAITRFANKSDHKHCDSTIVVILTHGTHEYIYGSDGDVVKIETFIAHLNGANCPALKNKPKLFIIQACRGDTYDEGVDGGGYADHGRNYDDDNLNRAQLRMKLAAQDVADAKSIEKTPKDADIIIACATTPGYVSWRNTLRGSWFIQAICDVFARNAWKEEILHLFTEVNRIVSKNISGTGHKQVPEPSYRLTKKFYLLPGLNKQ